jgi:hypothetical protein
MSKYVARRQGQIVQQMANLTGDADIEAITKNTGK